jgi:hypothetical protein
MAYREKDYIKRQLAELARVLAAVMGLKDGGRPDEARAELEKGARSMLGVGMMPLGRVDVASAVGLLRSSAAAETYARLLEAEADLESTDRAEALRKRAADVRRIAV